MHTLELAHTIISKRTFWYYGRVHTTIARDFLMNHGRPGKTS